MLYVFPDSNMILVLSMIVLNVVWGKLLTSTALWQLCGGYRVCQMFFFTTVIWPPRQSINNGRSLTTLQGYLTSCLLKSLWSHIDEGMTGLLNIIYILIRKIYKLIIFIVMTNAPDTWSISCVIFPGSYLSYTYNFGVERPATNIILFGLKGMGILVQESFGVFSK